MRRSGFLIRSSDFRVFLAFNGICKQVNHKVFQASPWRTHFDFHSVWLPQFRRCATLSIKIKQKKMLPICRESVNKCFQPTRSPKLNRRLVLTPRPVTRHRGARVKRGGLLAEPARGKSKRFGQTWPGETSGRTQMLRHTDWGAGITRQDPLWSWADILNAPSRKVLYPVARFPTDRSLSLFVSFS